MTTVDRMFQLWAYTVSHSQLLLRSPKGDGLTTRIDIVFFGVDRLSVSSVFSPLSVSLVPPDRVGMHAEAIGDRKVWLLTDGVSEGFVVAVRMAIHEDELEYNEPSAIYDPWLVAGLQRSDHL